MEKRILGRTGHASTVAVFGAAALGRIGQEEADAVMELVISAGINHIDVAPSYGEAELRLGPWLSQERRRFFLGCKTLERYRTGAADELFLSLERLQVNDVDLYQFHAVNQMEELDKITGRDGALEAVVAAREEKLTRFIGITSHGLRAPEVIQEALHRFDFDTVMFPFNFTLYSDSTYRKQISRLIPLCRQKGAGMLVIKAVAKQPWPGGWTGQPTWYQPFEDPADIQVGVNFVLSQAVTALCTPSNASILPAVLAACEHYTPLDAREQAGLMLRGRDLENIFSDSGRKGVN